MLHLNFGLNFEALVEDLMEKLKTEWKDPFEPPVILFPDRVLEQWFKLKWVERGQENPVIANLNTQFLDEFVFNVLEHDANTARLKPIVLGEKIAAWIRDNLDSCGDSWNDVKYYLYQKSNEGNESNDSTKPYHIDENRLYDFAVLMSGLLIEYETSRPDYLGKPGVMRLWEAGESFFDAPGEVWQRELYCKLFNDGSFWDRDRFEHIAKRSLEMLKTLPSIYQSSGLSKNRRGKVFILWHATMGQFYRKVIEDYAAQKGNDVYAYIQNPCMEFWEDVEKKTHRCGWRSEDRPDYFKKDISNEIGGPETCFENENTLLVNWGRAGRDNIRLWCQAIQYDFEFKGEEKRYESVKTEYDTLLHQIQHHVCKRSNEKSIVITDEDISLKISAAPSKIREIEHLHSEICDLMHHHDAKIKDILIVAPSINEYRTTINQVFAQSATLVAELRREKLEGSALHIPFILLDGAPRESLTAAALRVLFKIVERGALLRPDFFELVRNPLVQKVRGIISDEVDDWQNWVYQLNIYRKRNIADSGLKERDDWKLGVKRLLMSRLSNDRIDDHGKTILPFADIASGDDDSLCRFIDCVEELEQLSEFGSRYPGGLIYENLEKELIPAMQRWLALSSVPKSFTAENIIYQSVMERVDVLRYQYAAMADEAGKIPWKYLEQAFCNAAEASNYTTGSLFVNGLTFMNFTAARVLPVKHLFMIGMDAASFPGRANRSSLDLRRTHPWPGDTDSTSRNRYAFLCQLMSTSESLHISYVNKDLRKDEDFYPSSVVNDLLDYIRETIKVEQTIDKDEAEACRNHAMQRITYNVPLDETRPLEASGSCEMLYTKRELRNYDIYRRLMGKSIQHEQQDAPKELEIDAFGNLPERVSQWLVKKYLDDPFQMRVLQLFSNDDYDVDDDPERIMYEPVDINNFELAPIVKEIAQLVIRSRYENDHCEGEKLDDASLNQCIQSDIDGKIGLFFKACEEENLIFDAVYEDAIRERIKKYAENVAIQLEAKMYENAYSDPFEVDLVCRVTDSSGEEHAYPWTLVCNRPEWHNKPDDETKPLHVVAVKMGKCDGKVSDYISAYVTALAYLIYLDKHEGREVSEVILEVLSAEKESSKNTDGLRFSLSASNAEEILNQIYRYAFIEQHYEAAPLKVIEGDKAFDDTQKSEITTIEQLREKLMNGEHGAWSYFKKGKLFIDTNLGYDEVNFETHWKDVVERQKGLLKYADIIVNVNSEQAKAKAEKDRANAEKSKLENAIKPFITAKVRIENAIKSGNARINKLDKKPRSNTFTKIKSEYVDLIESFAHLETAITSSNQNLELLKSEVSASNFETFFSNYCKYIKDIQDKQTEAKRILELISEKFKAQTGMELNNI